MPGMKGFSHSCEVEKKSKSANKKSIKDSPFSYAQIDMIWDFYVTHTISGGSGLSRTLLDYGWENTNNQKTGYGAVEKELLSSKYFEKICFIRAKECKDTLSAMDLSNDMVCSSHTRAVLLQKFHIIIDENESIKYDSSSQAESKLNALFRHLRNSFAHANTYFFDDGTVLLEDYEGKKITASILINQQTLLDWIRFIDKNQNYYVLIDACASCKTEVKEECRD